MHPRAINVQQNGHKCHAAIPSQKIEDSKNSINFLLQYKLCGLINYCCCVTLPSPGIAKLFGPRAEFATA